jgi:hypothetical protein
MTNPAASHPSSAEVPPSRKRLLPWFWPLLLAVIYLTLNTVILLQTVKNPDLAEKMQAKDSRQYLEIATQFASGDFSMSYVKEMPHRQPLYPLCLAPVIRIWGPDLVKEGYVNVIVGLIGLFCIYYGILKLFDSAVLAIVISLAYTANAFMLDKTACRLMTEALHIVALIVLILLYLAYLKRGKTVYLGGAAAAAGMDYLARTNGLFVMAAMFFTVGIYDLWRLAKPRVEESAIWFSRLRTLVLKYVVALAVFAIVTTPSWVPRYVYYRSPFYHGYLSNFMWVDTYDQAHTGQIKSDFTWKDYAKSHDLGGFVQRWTHGFYHVYYDVPRHTEHVRYLYLFFLIGVVTAFAKRRWDYGLLFFFLFVQELPVVWTIIANPGPRIPYGNLFPFELFFTALALATLCPPIHRWARSLQTKKSDATSSQ